MDNNLFLLCLLLIVCAACHSSRLEAGAHELTMAKPVDGQRLSFQLHVPASDQRPEEGWPVLLFLHGAGERGDDLSLINLHGPPKLLEEIPELAGCVLIAPQCPANEWWQSGTLKALLDEASSLTDVDASRLYVSGLSMGGYGTWGLLADYPEAFAAAVPICGGGEIGRLWKEITTGFRIEDLLRARDVPIRAFHGARDSVIPLAEAELLVLALEGVGADVELTVYPGVEHDSWTQTYANPGLYTWLFAQRR
ncbi:MAG: putative peptidase [Planctomycetota bacterium]|jgi:predicted peptidase